MSVDTPYARLLVWAAGDVFPATPGVADIAKLAIARSVRQNTNVAQHVCGLEFHHDGSCRVDCSLACLSSLCSFDGLLMPNWWGSFLAGCDALDTSYALHGGPFAAIDTAHLPPSLVPAWRQGGVVLPNAHCLEFDHDPAGIRLAGVFQPLCASAHDQPFTPPGISDWSRTWNRVPLGGSLGCSDLFLDGLLEMVRQQLGWPLWIGLMCGRENLLKLVFRDDGLLHQRLIPLLHSQGLEANRVLEALADRRDGPHEELRLSLDLDLSSQRLLPSLALEWYPSCVTRETRTWELLDQLASQYSLQPMVVADVKSQLARLPQGFRTTLASSELQALMPLVNLSVTKAAKLSHYKLSLAAGGDYRLKSYVSLTWMGF